MRPCPACGERRAEPLFEKNGHVLVRCPGCATARVAELPSPESLRAIYDLSYFKGRPDRFGYADYLAEEPFTREGFARKAARLRGLVGGGRVLDVGCATGSFLDLLGPGFEKKGVELSSEIVDAAPAPPGVDIWLGDFLSYPGAPGSFDAVTMWDVLDHVADPGACLDKARALLRPGGILALNLGDRESLLARLLGRRWHIYIPPTHLSFFSARGLESLLRARGFRALDREYEWKSVPFSLVLFRLSYILGWAALGRLGAGAAETWWGRIKLRLYTGDVLTMYAERLP